MDKATVIFLVTHTAPGGVQELWSDLAAGFRRAGHQVHQIALYPPREQAACSTAPGWTYIAPKRPVGVIGAVKLLVALARYFRFSRPAMVFSAMPAANVAAPIAALLARQGVRVSTSHHSPSSTYNRVLNALDSITGTLWHTRAVICVGDTVARSLERKPSHYRSKVCKIPNALSPHIEESLRRLYSLLPARPAGRRRVVAIGRLSKEKNYLTLIRCAQLLRDIEVIIVGAGPEEAVLRAESTLIGVDNRVHFLGAKSRVETLEIVSSADAFVQPSVFEGHSLALIEAAKLGLPLVVSDVASQVEAVTRAGEAYGIVIALYDHVSLANAIQGLMDDADLRQYWATRAYALGETSSFAGMLDAYRALVPA